MRKDPNPDSVFTCIHRPVPDMVEEIKSGNGLSFGSGKLRELCKLLPDEREVLVTAFLCCSTSSSAPYISNHQVFVLVTLFLSLSVIFAGEGAAAV